MLENVSAPRTVMLDMCHKFLRPVCTCLTLYSVVRTHRALLHARNFMFKDSTDFVLEKKNLKKELCVGLHARKLCVWIRYTLCWKKKKLHQCHRTQCCGMYWLCHQDSQSSCMEKHFKPPQFTSLCWNIWTHGALCHFVPEYTSNFTAQKMCC